MIRKVLQVVVMLGLVAACGRDKPDSLEQQGADSAASDTTGLAAAPAPSASKGTPPAAAGTKGTATPSAPSGGAPSQSAGAGNAPAPEPELISAKRLWTVQVGSFSDAQNAEAMRARLERLGVPAWTSATTIGGQPYTRVRIGVATNTEDVQAIGVKIRTNYGWNTWLAMVEDRSAVPPNGLSATRAYLAAP